MRKAVIQASILASVATLRAQGIRLGVLEVCKEFENDIPMSGPLLYRVESMDGQQSGATLKVRFVNSLPWGACAIVRGYTSPITDYRELGNGDYD